MSLDYESLIRAPLACVTCYYNPARYALKRRNYEIFKAGLSRAGVVPLTVELSFDGSFELPEGANIVRLTASSVLWQKERLINHAIGLLPAQIRKVAWLDCDGLWERRDWPGEAARMLDNCDLLQLFDELYHLPAGQESFGTERAIASRRGAVAWHRGKGPSRAPGVPGMAWAARRELFDELGLYDRAVIGGGDLIFGLGLAKDLPPDKFAGESAYDRHVRAWLNRVRSLDLSFDCLKLKVCHLWHGDLERRRYSDREGILRRHGFDPENDLRLGEGAYEWATGKPELHAEVRRYFEERREDDAPGLLRRAAARLRGLISG